MHRSVLALCLLLVVPLAAQQSIEARIIDATSSQPLPYATIVVHGTTRGTITNGDGRFSVPVRTPSDSLRISYIGYNTKLVPLTAALQGTDIRLHRAMYVLGEAVVRPGEDLYQRFVAASNWLRRAPMLSTKLYFSLDTHSEGVPVEAMEGYFNATFNSATLVSMNFKQGMIGITPKDGRHFINYNTASALVCLDIHGGQRYFPSSPFTYTAARALKKHYTVERISIGSGADGVEQLTAVPRDGAAAGFSATLWLVPGSSTVRALELWCIDCPKHPIIPLFDNGRIDTVDLRYKQTWSTTGPPIPEVIQVDYGVAYTGPDFHERYTSSAVLHAFDRGKPFLPTLFPWKQGVNEYPMIAWMPRDTAFWSRMSPPVPTERQQRDRALLLRNDVTQNTWFDSLRLEYPHIQPHYVAWSKDRCIDHTHFSGAPEDRPNDGRTPPPVQMRTHLYLDLDTTGGVLHHRTLAVLDARSSWYLYPWEPWASAYCTLLLDLCEIERRALEQRLNEPGMTLSRAQQLHKEHTQRMKDEQKRMYTNVENYVIQLRSWNVRVREALGVDRYDDANVGPPGSSIEP